MPARVLFVSLGLLSGCGSPCDTLWYRDFDGDGAGDPGKSLRECEAPPGYVTKAGDCDDRDSGRFPDAFDACNGVDDDCDGETDPDPTTFYADADGDGFGTTELTIEGCDQPLGFVEVAGDCNDDDDAARPGAPERCNTLDDDCDGIADEDAEGDEIWYRDRDGDGYGTNEEYHFCGTPPVGNFSRLSGDCDDEDGRFEYVAFNVNPGRLEYCDGLDNDCDGLVDDDDPLVEDAIFVWSDVDGDGSGGSPSGRRRCDGTDISPDVWSGGDCDDFDGDVTPGGTERCTPGDEDCDGLFDEDDPSLGASGGATGVWLDADGDGFGGEATDVVCVVAAPYVTNSGDCDDADAGVGPDLWFDDADGDGFGAGSPTPGLACRPRSPDQVNVSSPDCDDTRPDVRPGALDACGDGLDADCSGFEPLCSEPWSGAGNAVSATRATFAIAGRDAGVADLDQDGVPDLVLGRDGGLAFHYGALPEAYALPLPDHELADDRLTGALWATSATGVGRILAARDDGRLDEYQVGPDRTVTTFAETWVDHPVEQILGSGLPPDASGLPPVILVGGSLLSRVSLDQARPWAADALLATNGPAVAVAAGDADGDGGPDLGIGVASLGAAYVLPVDLQFSGFLANEATATLTGGVAGRYGAAITALDWDGDGLGDLAVGAPLDDTVGAAAAGAVVVSSIANGELFTVYGTDANDLLGTSVAAIDLDGDGREDLVVGAPGARAGAQGGGLAAGFLAGTLGVADRGDGEVLWTGSRDEGLGQRLGTGDLDGDLREDLLLFGPELVHALVGPN